MYISNINSASIKLNDISIQQVPQNRSLTLQDSESLMLVFVNKGAGDYYDADQGIAMLKKRELLIINPNQAIRITPIRKMECIIIKLSGILFLSSAQLDAHDRFFHVRRTTPTFKHYVDLAILELQQRFRGTDLILKKLIECLVVHILRDNNLSIKDGDTQAKNYEIKQIQDYIRKNYAKKITLDDLAEVVDINKYYLIRLFKQSTGLSPIDYLIHVRLEEAEKLLIQSNLPVATISDKIGFHSPSHFSKTFKELNHITPTAYRKRHTQYEA